MILKSGAGVLYQSVCGCAWIPLNSSLHTSEYRERGGEVIQMLRMEKRRSCRRLIHKHTHRLWFRICDGIKAAYDIGDNNEDEKLFSIAREIIP